VLALLSARQAGFHPNRRLLEAAEQAGMDAALVHPFALRTGIAGGRPWVGGEWPPHTRVVLPRLGATVSPWSLGIIRHLEMMGLAVVNGSAAMALAADKFRAAARLGAAGLAVLDTCLVASRADYAAALERLGGPPVVVKLPSARQGTGVFLVTEPGDNPQIDGAPLMAFVDRRRGVAVQRYVPPEERREFRVLVVGGEPVAAVRVRPAAGEFRANLHQGGYMTPARTQGRLGELAVAAAGALGLEVAGVDLMDGPMGLVVGEANLSPGFRGLEEAAGVDAAGAMVALCRARLDGP